MDFTVFQIVLSILGALLGLLAILVIYRIRDDKTQQIRPFLIKFMVVAILLSLSCGIGTKLEKAENRPALKITGLYTAFGSQLAPSLAFFTTVILNFYAIFSVVECSFIQYFQPFEAAREEKAKLNLYKIVQVDLALLLLHALAVGLLSQYATSDMQEISPILAKLPVTPAEEADVLLGFPYSHGIRTVGLILFFLTFLILHFANIVAVLVAIRKEKRNGTCKEQLKECIMVHMALLAMSSICFTMSVIFGFAVSSTFPGDCTASITRIYTIQSSGYSLFCSFFVLFYIKIYRYGAKSLLCGRNQEGTISPQLESGKPLSAE